MSGKSTIIDSNKTSFMIFAICIADSFVSINGFLLNATSDENFYAKALSSSLLLSFIVFKTFCQCFIDSMI